MKIFLVPFFLLFYFSAFSQVGKQKVKPFVEIGAGTATGITRNVYSGFLDSRAGLSYSVSDQIDLEASAGYVYFLRKSGKNGVSFLPLIGGIHYNMVSKLFLSMQAGGALLLDGSGSLYAIVEPGVGWRFNSHHSVRLSYLGFVTNGVMIGGINFNYRYQF